MNTTFKVTNFYYLNDSNSGKNTNEHIEIKVKNGMKHVSIR